MAYEVSRQAVEGAKGAMDPEFVVRGQYDDTFRPNNAEELRNLGGLQFFKQRSMLYSAALEAMIPSGARTRLGFDVRHLNNNLQPFRVVEQEWSSFFGLSIVQPLLKGAGKNVTMAAVRVAALESDQAYQEFRRQMMVILVGAEVAYRNLYFAQEQQRFYQESLGIVTKFAKDVEARFEAGKATELDVLNARVAVSGREARLAVADQSLAEAMNMAIGFAGPEAVPPLRAARPDSSIQTDFNVAHCFDAAQRYNPEYLGRQRQITIESLRLDLAKNQRKPTLDFLGSIGLTGLSESFSDSLTDIGNARYPTWSVGLEFRVPIGGGRKAKSDLKIAELRRRQAIRQLGLLRTQLRGAVENALLKVRATKANMTSLAETTNLNQKLLHTEMERLDTGKSSTGNVLEAEDALFEARNLELQNLTELQQALLELDILMGVVLEKRGIELSQAELATKTATMLKRQEISDEDLQAYRQSLERIIQSEP